MAIPAQFIDELVARSEITDIVSSYVTLTRKGDRLWGLCPFHNEKTASFSVVAERQAYHCFGCGKGGGVITFIMEIENLPFVDAVGLLAKRAGMQVPETGQDESHRRRRESVLALNREAARYFHSQLNSSAGEEGAGYLYEKRRLSKGTVRRFGLGVAPEGWDNLILAMSELGYDKRDLLDAGLAVDNHKGGIYDRFRGRVMFPIIDLRGDVIGFGGRVLGDGQPKYLNSPDTVVYNKSRNLFALNIARKTKQGRMILTEGYMDTIALHQAGFDCAVASLGTAFTEEHAHLLSRYTKELVIAYDADSAGVSAAQRAIPILERTGMKVRVLAIQGAKDPDEFIKAYGPEAFARLLEQSENHIEYRLGQVQQKYNLEDDAQKVEFLRECAELISNLNSPVEREVYGRRMAEVAGIAADTMQREVELARKRRLKQAKKKKERRDLTPAVQMQPADRALRYENVHAARAEEGVLRLLLLEPELMRAVDETLTPEEFTSPMLRKTYEIMQTRYRDGMRTQLATLAGALSPAEISHLTKVFDQPQSREESEAAMQDYLKIMKLEATKRGGEGELDPLLALRQQYKEKKSFGGEPHE